MPWNIELLKFNIQMHIFLSQNFKIKCEYSISIPILLFLLKSRASINYFDTRESQPNLKKKVEIFIESMFVQIVAQKNKQNSKCIVLQNKIELHVLYKMLLSVHESMQCNRSFPIFGMWIFVYISMLLRVINIFLLLFHWIFFSRVLRVLCVIVPSSGKILMQ